MKGRLRCILFGCGSDEVGCCPDCGMHLYYDREYRQRGKLDWLAFLWWKLKRPSRFIVRRCDACGKRMWFRRRLESCCSDACYRNWIPF